MWPSRKFARTRQTCVVKNNSLKTMTYQVAQLLFICSRDTMCLDLFLLVHFIMIPKMFVSIITHWFNVLSLAQKWTHNPKKQFLLKYFWTSAFFFKKGEPTPSGERREAMRLFLLSLSPIPGQVPGMVPGTGTRTRKIFPCTFITY